MADTRITVIPGDAACGPGTPVTVDAIDAKGAVSASHVDIYSFSLAKADGTNECLMQIPHWDFDWQRRYDYNADIANLPTISPGG